MPHPAGLIQKISRLVEQDYPRETHQYQVETLIPKTRMFPDILVRDRDDNMLCAVEIGYTRPEKLTAYRDELKIPDVRWYDKQGRLHADVKEVAVSLTVSAEPACLLHAYDLRDVISCPGCEEGVEADISASAEEGTVLGEREMDLLFDATSDAVLTTLLTDHVRAWFPCFCDKCGGTWLDDGYIAQGICFDLGVESGREFARRYGRRTEIAWRGCVELVQDRFDLELRYEEGLFVDPNGAREWDRLLKARRFLATEAVA
jgi:hypothetical protein